jgi:hypothetical protein
MTTDLMAVCFLTPRFAAFGGSSAPTESTRTLTGFCEATKKPAVEVINGGLFRYVSAYFFKP